MNIRNSTLLLAAILLGVAASITQAADEFNRKAQALGRQCELWIADKMGHGFFNNQPWHDATTRKADEFLVSLGYLKGPPTIKDIKSCGDADP